MKNKSKILITALLIVLMMLSVVACGNTATNKSNTNNSSPTDSTTDNPSADIPSADNNDSEDVKLNKFAQFEKGLTNKNIAFEVNEKLASMVGAKEGYGYVFNNDASVELYLFDKNTDAYKEASKSNKITLESFGITMDVVFNDDICIYYNGEYTNKADVEAIFKDLK